MSDIAFHVLYCKDSYIQTSQIVFLPWAWHLHMLALCQDLYFCGTFEERPTFVVPLWKT